MSGSNILKMTGKIIFDPKAVTKKQKRSSRRIAMVVFNDDTEAYYRWFLKKRFHLNLLPTLRGTHITFIDDNISDDIYEKMKEKFNNKLIDVFIDVSLIRTNIKHWWLKVHSNELLKIRDKYELKKRYVGLHLTIGLTKGDEFELTEQIFDYIQKYNL